MGQVFGVHGGVWNGFGRSGALWEGPGRARKDVEGAVEGWGRGSKESGGGMAWVVGANKKEACKIKHFVDGAQERCKAAQGFFAQ